MNFIQSAGLTGLCLILSFVAYSKASKNEHALRWMTKIYIILAGALLFVNVNLYHSAKIQIATTAVIEKYMIPATFDLIGSVHDPKNKIRMEENRIYINEGTDNQKIFILMKEPFFGIINQAQAMELSKDLGDL